MLVAWAVMATAAAYGSVIDAHVHLNGVNPTAVEFYRQAREAGVTGFVCHLPTEKSVPPAMPGLSSAFCAGVHENPDLPAIEAGIKGGRFKCIKIYLGYSKRYAYDQVYSPLYDLAERTGVPVVFHTGDTSSPTAKVKYADPLTIDEVAVDHPHVKLVIAHLGNPWIQSAAEVAYKNKNVYVDVSGIMIGDLSKSPDTDLQKYLIEPVRWAFGYIDGTEKMMFGTDWPLVNIKQYLDAVTRAIPPEHHRAFLHDNAARVFNIRSF